MAGIAGAAKARVPLTDAQRDRVESHIGIAKSVALSLAGTMCPADLDDMIGMAFLALMRAAQKCDEGYEDTYPGLAYLAVRNDLINALEARRSRLRRAFSLNARDMIYAPEFDGPGEDELAILRGFLGRLTPKHRRFLELRFGLVGGEPRLLEEVGREMGVSRQRAHQIEGKALASLRTMYRAHERQYRRATG